MRHRLALTALALATAVTAGMAAPATAAAPDPVRQGLETLVHDDHAPGALASVRDGSGHVRSYTTGVGDRDTQAKVPRDGQVRIGSVTKTFTAVVVLQLVGEGRIGLDDTVEKHLPGLVRGKDIDGNNITVRQLLQHTSGLPDYEQDVTGDILERRYISPRDALDIALKHTALFEPGEKDKWGYSSTNYLLAGLIVERVTGRPFAEEVHRRVIQKTGLRHTYFPAPGETVIRERHPQGYRQEPGAGPRNVTAIDPSASWAAGAMVSTNSDLNTFFSALLGGRLLNQPELDAMRTTVQMRENDPDHNAGLGIITMPLPCADAQGRKRVAWAHSGTIPGYGTWSAATDDGRAASATMTLEISTNQAVEHLQKTVASALCR
ncbi:serine hydrolase domain-containing protein [Streptomyces roseoverticillatus]|uniref:serine hydrolase domain-containing protein n=1 Tax=Streptomyces roseoverticillatus TaxID=66429 RepID=UPI0033C0F4BF